MSSAKFSPISVFLKNRNPLTAGGTVKILYCIKILKDLVLLLIGIAVCFRCYHRSLKKK